MFVTTIKRCKLFLNPISSLFCIKSGCILIELKLFSTLLAFILKLSSSFRRSYAQNKLSLGFHLVCFGIATIIKLLKLSPAFGAFIRCYFVLFTYETVFIMIKSCCANGALYSSYKITSKITEIISLYEYYKIAIAVEIVFAVAISKHCRKYIKGLSRDLH